MRRQQEGFRSARATGNNPDPGVAHGESDRFHRYYGKHYNSTFKTRLFSFLGQTDCPSRSLIRCFCLPSLKRFRN
jgi:hypothetical protein